MKGGCATVGKGDLLADRDLSAQDLSFRYRVAASATTSKPQTPEDGASCSLDKPLALCKPSPHLCRYVSEGS